LGLCAPPPVARIVDAAHDLSVVDLRVAFEGASKRPEYALKRFSTWPEEFQFTSPRVRRGEATALLPDAYASSVHR
jgi:hypothetical protein